MDKEFKINESINYRDIISWRDRQEQWQSLELKGDTDVKTEI